jgi:hypothetical protein
MDFPANPIIRGLLSFTVFPRVRARIAAFITSILLISRAFAVHQSIHTANKVF